MASLAIEDFSSYNKDRPYRDNSKLAYKDYYLYF